MPRIRCEYTVAESGYVQPQITSSDSLVGWTGHIISIQLPKVVEHAIAKLRFSIEDGTGNVLQPSQVIPVDIYIGYSVAGSGPVDILYAADSTTGATVTHPTVPWLRQATAWARGARDQIAVASNLMAQIYNHSGYPGWRYRDEGTSWSELLNGTSSVGNCFSMAALWVASCGMVGVEGRLDDYVYPKRFVTLPDHSRAFDANTGNTHLLNQPVADRWTFSAHAFGVLDVDVPPRAPYYDPTFNMRFARKPEDFVLSHVIGVQGNLRTLQNGHTLILENYNREAAPWGWWRYE